MDFKNGRVHEDVLIQLEEFSLQFNNLFGFNIEYSNCMETNVLLKA